MDEILTGGCLCGEVRYRITAAPVEALYCHCRMCQRAHGAPVIAWLTVPLAAFEVSSGNPVAYRSSAKAFRHFCGACGWQPWHGQRCRVVGRQCRRSWSNFLSVTAMRSMP